MKMMAEMRECEQWIMESEKDLPLQALLAPISIAPIDHHTELQRPETATTTTKLLLLLLHWKFPLEQQQTRSQRPSKAHSYQRQQQQQQKAEQSLAIRGTKMNWAAAAAAPRAPMMMDEFIALENNFINCIIIIPSSGISVGRQLLFFLNRLSGHCVRISQPARCVCLCCALVQQWRRWEWKRATGNGAEVEEVGKVEPIHRRMTLKAFSGN